MKEGSHTGVATGGMRTPGRTSAAARMHMVRAKGSSKGNTSTAHVTAHLQQPQNQYTVVQAKACAHTDRLTFNSNGRHNLFHLTQPKKISFVLSNGKINNSKMDPNRGQRGGGGGAEGINAHVRTLSLALRDCASSMRCRSRRTLAEGSALKALARRLMASCTVARMPSGSVASALKNLAAVSTSAPNTLGARCMHAYLIVFLFRQLCARETLRSASTTSQQVH